MTKRWKASALRGKREICALYALLHSGHLSGEARLSESKAVGGYVPGGLSPARICLVDAAHRRRGKLWDGAVCRSGKAFGDLLRLSRRGQRPGGAVCIGHELLSDRSLFEGGGRLEQGDRETGRTYQNAYLHSGLAYLQLKDRTRARMAFEQASAMTFDRNVQEQALYNYALCIHETSYSPFAESVTVFERFLNEFPNSAYAAKVNDYLVEVYMNTRSYQAALNSIAKISHPGDRILEAKQKLLFRIGILAFAQAAFENAIGYFTQSIDLGRYDRQTKADAYYWRGESKYRLEQYAQAASDYRLYLEYTPYRTGEEYALALYNLGYVAFKQKAIRASLDLVHPLFASAGERPPHRGGRV